MYSLVIPIFNERETLPELYRRIKAVIDELDAPAEVIMVDDGSQDDSFNLLKGRARGCRCCHRRSSGRP